MVKVKQAFSYVSRGKSPNYIELSKTKVINQACIYWDGLHLENVKYQDSDKVKVDRYLNNNDVLINSTGTGTLGRCCIFTLNTDEVNYIADSHITVLRPSDDICASYFKYFVMRKETQGGIYSKCVSGSTNQIELSKEKLLEFLIPLPPLETQKKIAQTLDTVSEVLSMRKKQLAELDSLIKSTFYDMFGDPVTNEKGWDIKNINEIAEQKLSYGSGASAIQYDGITRYIRITDINDDGSLNENIVSPSENLEKYNLNDGDILFARSGATVGKTLRYRNCFGKCIYAGYLIRLIPNKSLVLPEYIYQFTKTNYYKRFIDSSIKTVAQPNINAKQYGELMITLPPLSLQNKFASIVAKIEEQKALVKKAIDETQLLFDSLMSKYFE